MNSLASENGTGHNACVKSEWQRSSIDIDVREIVFSL